MNSHRLNFIIFSQICIYIRIVCVNRKQITFISQQVKRYHASSVQLTCFIFKVPTSRVTTEIVWCFLVVAQKFVYFKFFTRNFVFDTKFITDLLFFCCLGTQIYWESRTVVHVYAKEMAGLQIYFVCFLLFHVAGQTGCFFCLNLRYVHWVVLTAI